MNPVVAGILGEKSKEELIVLLTDLAARYPEVKRKILEDEQLRSGRIDKLAIDLRKEIKAVTGEPAWTNRWNDEGSRPDYSHIKEQFAALLKEGHADIVVELVFWFNVNWTFGSFVINKYKRRKIHAKKTSQLHPGRKGFHFASPLGRTCRSVRSV
jgi:hypothetical protein